MTRPATMGLALGVLTFACAPSAPVSTNAPPTARVAPPRPSATAAAFRHDTLLLSGEDGLVHAAWAGPRAVYAASERALWRIAGWGRDGQGSDATRIVARFAADEAIQALAAASGADVAAVVAGDTVHVFREGRPARTIAGLPKANSTRALLSENGRRLAWVGQGSAGWQTVVFDSETGARVSEFAGDSEFHPSGDWALDEGTVTDVRTGRVVAKGAEGFRAHPTWVASRAVFVGDKEVVTVETPGGTRKRADIRCTPISSMVLSAVVDVLGRRVVIDCGDRVVFFEVSNLSRREVKLPAKMRLEAPPRTYEHVGEPAERFEPGAPSLAVDGTAAFVQRIAPEEAFVVVDPAGGGKSPRAVRPVELPPTRAPANKVVSGVGAARCRIGPKSSPAEWWCTATPAPDDAAAVVVAPGGGVSVVDAGGVERVRFGMPSELAIANVHYEPSGGGIDLAFAGDGARTTSSLRLGPSGVPPVTTEPAPAPPSPDGLRCDDARFVEASGTVAKTCYSGGTDRHELLLVDRAAATSRRHVLPSTSKWGYGPPLAIGARSVAIDVARGYSRGMVMVDRKSGAITARVGVWPGAAAVRYADGAVELFGESAEDGVVCLQGDVVTRFSSCRTQATVSGRFTLD